MVLVANSSSLYFWPETLSCFACETESGREDVEKIAEENANDQTKRNASAGGMLACHLDFCFDFDFD